MVGLAAIEINRLTSVAALEPVWTELEKRSDASFFLTWNWIGTWLEMTQARPLVVTLGDKDGMIAMALLQDGSGHRLGVFPTRFGALHETGDAAQDSIYIEYNGVLAARNAPASVLGHMLMVLLDQGLDEIRLSAVAAWTVNLAAGTPWIVTTRKASRCYAVDLVAVRSGPSSSYIDTLSANTRHQIRRSERLYAARGPVALAAAESLEQAKEFFAGLKALHQQTWTARGQAGAFANPFFERFHDRLIERLWPQGGAELVKISAGTHVVGYLYNFRHRGAVLNYQSGFAPETDNKLKPGLLSHALCIERHLANGAARYDLMAGEARYKQNLASPQDELVWLTLQRPGLLTSLETFVRRVKRALARQPNSLA